MSNVQLNADTIVINGQPKILLCASLFYFRIPRENWEERMKQLRMLGYNCIDVYMPWNFHESSPNVWNFEGMYDVDAFLALATQYQLYVIARPGPYICSEWDGGALPSWLYKADIELRQDEPEYLKQLERWLQRILPIIAAHEVDRGGSVVAVQLENEMDYFACKAPEQYMRKLQETALCYGITVPLTACAGQCDVQGAGGLVQGVHPTFNAYSDDTFAHLECQLAHMRALAAELGTPLMITETDRIHAKLKRELASGARLISPYNQVGGSNVDMTNGISNWAEDVHRPLALMASDYDFDSMLTVSGRLRAQAG
ncbi:MAG: beta-galactosidase, partial [Acinetobacter sp.]